jgi:2-aminobenzoate-CoA ligase
MTAYTAHSDSFARDHLPAKNLWPELVFSLPELNYPERLNCAALILDRHVDEGRGEKIAVHGFDLSLTYRELQHWANRIAHVLVEDRGLKPGNRVLLRSANNAMLMACWFAVVKAGGIVVATMPMLREKELAVIIDKALISHAICDRRLDAELKAVEENSATLKEVMYFGGDDRELEGKALKKPASFQNVDTATQDVCLLGFTSGTTGTPKATMHFHRDVLAMAHTVGRHVIKPEEDEIFCGSPPLAFTFGLGAELVFPLYFGCTTVLVESPSQENLFGAIEKYGVTTLFTAPTAYRSVLPCLKDHDISTLRKCVSAGEHLPKATFDAWYEATGIKIIDGLGSTEMIHIFIASSGAEIRPGAIGKVVPGYEACILDRRYRPLAPGKIGRLAVKGPTGCRYLADERQKSYVVKGWNITGDSARMDADGYFWFEARADDMIISSGYNISGPEVEAALMAHEAVQECAVVGSPDPDRGHIVKAFVILKDPSSASAGMVKALQTFVKETVAPYKYPRAIEFLESLPKTPTGKIQRFRLRKLEEEKAQKNNVKG